ncbi:MAG: hypothetical protein ABIA63_07560 [bacterium]
MSHALKNRRIILLPLVLIVSLFIAHAVYLNCVAEDAFISFRFAKHLAQGYGIKWNIGEPPVEGYTNFLWVIICAAVYKMGFNLPGISQVLGILAAIGTLSYVFLFASNILNLRGVTALLPCLFLAIAGPFATWAASGMETNLFGLLLMMGTYYSAKFWKDNLITNLNFSLISLFLATLTRPEGFFVYGIISFLSIMYSLNKSRPKLKSVLAGNLTFIIPFALYFVWRFSYFGYPLPNTFYAKTGGGLYQIIRGAKYTICFGFYYLSPLFLMCVLFLISQRNAIINKIPGIKSHLILNKYIYSCIAICITYSLYITLVGGDYMAMYRFYVPILPFFCLWFGFLTDILLKELGDARIKKFTYALVICGGAFTFLHSTPLEKRLFKQPPLQHGHYRGVQTEKFHTARLSLIGKFFNKYKKGLNESLASGAIGAISFYADIKIYGLHGLVDTHISHMHSHEAHNQIKAKPLGTGFPGHEKGDLKYIFSKRPTYFMFSRWFYPNPRDYPSYSVEIDEIIRKNYKLSWVFLEDKINSQSGYFTFLELKNH